MKPIIGITAGYKADEDDLTIKEKENRRKIYNFVTRDYANAINRSGGVAVILPTPDSKEDTYALMDKLDGVILSGGNDINPVICKQCADEYTGELTCRRDDQELDILEYIFNKRSIPLLGICRGSQILNAYLGGSLILNISSEIVHNQNKIPRYSPVHSVDVEEESELIEILGNKRIFVNSIHHQAIDRLGRGLKIAAKSQDNIVEAVEMINNDHNIIGIQWHPEILFDSDEASRNLFIDFVRRCEN